MGWKGRKYVREDVKRYPVIQWVNAGSSLEPRSEIGGFAMPSDQASTLGSNIPGTLTMLHHRGGDQTEVIFTTALQVAVLSTRFCWVKSGQAIPYEPGARGKLQALSLVRDADGQSVGLVILTFRGHGSKQFSVAWKAHQETVRTATAGAAPAYAFFGDYKAGGTVMVGKNQQSPITSVVYDGEGFDPDAVYIGDAALDALDWDAVDTWKSAWDIAGNSNGNGNSNGDAHNAAPPQPQPQSKDDATSTSEPRDPNAPASPAQRSLIKKLLGELGYKDDKHDAAITGAGYDPAGLLTSSASDLITRLLDAKKNGNGK